MMNSETITADPSLTARLNQVGIRRIPRPTCPLCGEEGEELYGEMSDWLFAAAGKWSLRSCGSCELAWQDPRAAEEDISKLYARYYTHRSEQETVIARFRRATYQFALARKGYSVARPQGILARLISNIPSVARAAELDVLGLSPVNPGTLLDVGCGNGEFAARMQSLGWTVSGVDPDPAAVKRGTNQDIHIFQGTIADVPHTNRYDVITLSHVIEHVVDPVALLRECSARLRPQTGILVLTTPNLKSLGHRWFKRFWRGLEVPRHLILFSPASLSDCVTQAGLRVRSIRTETRIARMIFAPSFCAKRGSVGIGEWTNFKVSIKCAAYAFQLLEDVMAYFFKNVGEEIYCVCTALKEDDAKQA
jgi:2-polyprenyl-3-methyl-5-hydroxy-6-metoxy-1,4-benzoquinol methylase